MEHVARVGDEFWQEDLKERDHLQNLHIDGSLILICLLKD
jgi:hypothetical protein